MIRNRLHPELLIAQPAHAHLALKIFRQIDKSFLLSIKLREELELAIGLHDIGWTDWEINPALNGLTGYPYDFTGMPTEEHANIWEKGSRRMATINRFAGLLVSLHNLYLANKHDFSNDTDREKKAIELFVANEKEYQQTLITSLAESDTYQNFLGEENLMRMRKWIGFCDYLSLLVCMGLWETEKVKDLPESLETNQLTVIPASNEHTYIVDPWIFSSDHFQLNCDAIYIKAPQSSQRNLVRYIRDQNISRHTVILKKVTH